MATYNPTPQGFAEGPVVTHIPLERKPKMSYTRKKGFPPARKAQERKQMGRPDILPGVPPDYPAQILL